MLSVLLPYMFEKNYSCYAVQDEYKRKKWFGPFAGPTFCCERYGRQTRYASLTWAFESLLSFCQSFHVPIQTLQERDTTVLLQVPVFHFEGSAAQTMHLACIQSPIPLDTPGTCRYITDYQWNLCEWLWTKSIYGIRTKRWQESVCAVAQHNLAIISINIETIAAYIS